MGRPRVVAFVSNPATHDARVLKEAQSLASAGYDVTLVAHWREGLPEDELRDGFRVIRIPGEPSRFDLPRSAGSPPGPAWLRVLRRLGLTPWAPGARVLTWIRENTPLALATRRWFRSVAQKVPYADVYHGHDLTGLAMAFRVRAQRGQGRIVYDSHELFMETAARVRMPGWVRWVWARTEGRLARRSDAVITVNSSIALELAERCRLARTPLVVMNCPPRWHSEEESLPERRLFHERLPIAPAARVMLYQGTFVPERGLELMPELLLGPGLASTVLVYLGYGRLKPQLESYALRPDLAGRVFVLDAVSPEDLLDWTASAAVCLMPLQPTTRNHWLVSPNKLFESLAAGVPVVASRFPEMVTVVRGWGVGELCDPTDPKDVAAAVSRVLSLPAAEYTALRMRCRQAALSRFNWETEAEGLLGLYASLAPR